VRRPRTQRRRTRETAVTGREADRGARARNLGSVAAEVWVTYTGVPPGGTFRIDAEDFGC